MEPKYPSYSHSCRYRPFCIEPTLGKYVVQDTLTRTTVPDPFITYKIDKTAPWRGKLIDRGLTRQQAEDKANKLNRLDKTPKSDPPKRLKRLRLKKKKSA